MNRPQKFTARAGVIAIMMVSGLAITAEGCSEADKNTADGGDGGDTATPAASDAGGSPARAPVETPAAAVTLLEWAAYLGCSAGGEPISADNVKNTGTDKNGTKVLPGSDPDYALGKFFCMIAAESGDEGSILGALSQSRLVTCLAGDDITYDGTLHVSTVVVADSTCFGSNKPDGLPAEITVEVTAAEPAADAADGWDRSYDISVLAGRNEIAGIHMLMTTTATSVAVACQGGATATDAYAFTLDTTNGTLRYESKSLRLPERGWSDHIRLLVKGTVDADGVFSDITKVEGASAVIHNKGTGTKVDSGRLMTIKGDATGGFRTYSYACGGAADANTCSGQDPAVWAAIEGTGQCGAGETGATCDGNDGIQLAAAADLAFLMRPAETGFQAAADWVAAMAPLAFASVTLAQSQD